MHMSQRHFAVTTTHGSAAPFVRWVVVDLRAGSCVQDKRRGSAASAALCGNKTT